MIQKCLPFVHCGFSNELFCTKEMPYSGDEKRALEKSIRKFSGIKLLMITHNADLSNIACIFEI